MYKNYNQIHKKPHSLSYLPAGEGVRCAWLVEGGVEGVCCVEGDPGFSGNVGSVVRGVHSNVCHPLLSAESGSRFTGVLETYYNSTS